MIEVKPEMEAKLRELAAIKGLSIDELLKSFVSDSIEGMHPPPTNGDRQTQRIDGRKKAEAFEAWSNKFAKDVPPLSREVISRSAIYDPD